MYVQLISHFHCSLLNCILHSKTLLSFWVKSTFISMFRCCAFTCILKCGIALLNLVQKLYFVLFICTSLDFLKHSSIFSVGFLLQILLTKTNCLSFLSKKMDYFAFSLNFMRPIQIMVVQIHQE